MDGGSIPPSSTLGGLVGIRVFSRRNQRALAASWARWSEVGVSAVRVCCQVVRRRNVSANSAPIAAARVNNSVVLLVPVEGSCWPVPELPGTVV